MTALDVGKEIGSDSELAAQGISVGSDYYELISAIVQLMTDDEQLSRSFKQKFTWALFGLLTAQTFSAIAAIFFLVFYKSIDFVAGVAFLSICGLFYKSFVDYDKIIKSVYPGYKEQILEIIAGRCR